MADEPNPPQTTPKKQSGVKGLAQAESMIQLALAVPAGCFVGLFVGYWLDRHFHQNWIAVAGMLLGAAGGFIQIFTTMSKYTKDKDDQ